MKGKKGSPIGRVRKVVGQMEFSDSQEKDIQCQFDWFCKKAMRNKAIDIDRKNKRENVERGIAISFEDGEIYIASHDEYFFERIKYEACGYVVYVKEDRLVNILNKLPDKKRNVLLLWHLAGLTDEEIAETLNITKKTLSEYKSRLIVKCKDIAEKNG